MTKTEQRPNTQTDQPTPPVNQLAGRCHAITKKGRPCEAMPLTGSRYCAVHDPTNQRAMAEARRRGGQAAMQKSALKVLDDSGFAGKSAADIGDLIVETINQVRTGQVDIRIANAVGYLSNILIKARETADLEQRVEKLEEIQVRMERG